MTDLYEDRAAGKKRRRENLKRCNPYARELELKQYQPKVKAEPYRRVPITKECLDELYEDDAGGSLAADHDWGSEPR